MNSIVPQNQNKIKVMSYKEELQKRQRSAIKKRQLSTEKVQGDRVLNQKLNVIVTKEQKLEYDIEKIDQQLDQKIKKRQMFHSIDYSTKTKIRNQSRSKSPGSVKARPQDFQTLNPPRARKDKNYVRQCFSRERDNGDEQENRSKAAEYKYEPISYLNIYKKNNNISISNEIQFQGKFEKSRSRSRSKERSRSKSAPKQKDTATYVRLTPVPIPHEAIKQDLPAKKTVQFEKLPDEIHTSKNDK